MKLEKKKGHEQLSAKAEITKYDFFFFFLVFRLVFKLLIIWVIGKPKNIIQYPKGHARYYKDLNA